MTSFNKVFSVDAQEYGYSCGSFSPVSSGSSIPVYVPKLMGGITATGTDTISTNALFDNASDCKPVFNTKVNRTKSFNATVKQNCNWLDKVNSAGVVPSGTMFTVEFLNGNISSPYVTTK